MREYDWENRKVASDKERKTTWLVYGFGTKPTEHVDFVEACNEYSRQKAEYNMAKLVRRCVTVTTEDEWLPRWDHNYDT